MAKGLGHWYIEVQKQGFWRGAPHTWMNRYVMSGDDPSAANAQAVIGVLTGIETQLHASYPAGMGVGLVIANAYGKAGGPPFASVPYNASQNPATATGFGGVTYSGNTQQTAPTLETCALIETPLNGLSSNGKPIYLRKYFRGVMYGGEESDISTGIPSVDTTHIATLVAPWRTGMGANNWVVIGTSGLQASGPPALKPYLVSHQVPRGRKKKSSSNSLLSIGADFARLKAAVDAGAEALL